MAQRLNPRWFMALALALLSAWYGLATLPYLADFPLIDWAQPMIAAPAYQLAEQGVYGSEMFTGFYRAEIRNYDHMPLYPLFLSAAFKGAGLGVWQARWVSVMAGWVTLALTFRLGRQMYGPEVGLLAAAALCMAQLARPNFEEVLRLGYQLTQSGIPLLDFARVIRFDVMVPLWVTAAGLCFHRAAAGARQRDYFLAGVFSGLATLTHLYGAFIVPVFTVTLIWHEGWRVLRRPAPYLILLGWALALMPYVLYVLQDWPAYRGQMLRHEGRFDLLTLAFYWDSLLHEPWRYLAWLGGSFRRPVLWPRVSFWLVILGIPLAIALFWHRLRQRPSLADRLMVIALPGLAGLLALLVNLKRYPYTALLLPFLALHLSFVIVTLWRAARRWGRWLIALILAAALVEGALGIWGSWQMARQTTPYARLTQALRGLIPSGARVLASHVAWFALADYEFRSANLAFILADRRYGLDPVPSLEQVVQRIDPDYIVMEQRLLKKYLDPASLPDDFIANLLRAFDEYLQRHCRAVTVIAAPDYGDIGIYHCARE